MKVTFKRPAFLILAVAATCFAAMLGSTSASADAGSCGVRVGGPAVAGGGSAGILVYTIRNKCSKAYRFDIYFTQKRQYSDSGCRKVPAKQYSYYFSSIASNNWVIRNC